MKKLFILLLAALALSSCTQTTPPVDDGGEHDILPPSKTEFRIDGELPEIGEFGKSERFYEDYTPYFIPSAEYGTIVPYVGSCKTYTESGEDGETMYSYNYLSYGFCTTDGKIVMDAPGKFNSVSLQYTDDGFEYYYITSFEESEDESYYNPTESLIVPTDGSWCIELPQGGWISYAGGGVICVQYPSTCIKIPEGSGGMTDIYGYDGEKITTLNGFELVNGYSHGLFVVSNWSASPSGSYYINLDSEIVLGPYMNNEAFSENGIAPVSDENGDSYLINTDGVRLTQTSYSNISRYTSDDDKIEIYCAAHTDDSAMYDVLDKNGDVITSVFAERSPVFSFPDGEIVYYYNDYNYDNYHDNWTWKKLDGTDFVSTEYNVTPNEYPSDDDYFTYYDSELRSVIIMNAKGETTAFLRNCSHTIAISSDGRYIAYASETYNASEGKNDYAVNIYDTETDKILLTLPGYGYVRFSADNKYVAISNYGDFNSESYAESDALYNLEMQKIEYDGLKNISLLSLGDKTYYNVCTNNSCILYDNNMNVLVKNYFE